MIKLTKGQAIKISNITENIWLDAIVEIVSENQQSIGLRIDGCIKSGKGYICNVLPLMATTVDGIYLGVMDEDKYEIKLNA